MNDLTPTEMMFIYDAVLNFSQREECASHPTLPSTSLASWTRWRPDLPHGATT